MPPSPSRHVSPSWALVKFRSTGGGLNSPPGFHLYMIRITIREVAGLPSRARKALATADLDTVLELSKLRPAAGLDVHTAAIFATAPLGMHLQATTAFTPTVLPAQDIWRYVFEALAACHTPALFAPVPSHRTRHKLLSAPPSK